MSITLDVILLASALESAWPVVAVLTIFSVLGPAVWSRKPSRRRAALALARVLAGALARTVPPMHELGHARSRPRQRTK